MENKGGEKLSGKMSYADMVRIKDRERKRLKRMDKHFRKQEQKKRHCSKKAEASAD